MKREFALWIFFSYFTYFTLCSGKWNYLIYHIHYATFIMKLHFQRVRFLLSIFFLPISCYCYSYRVFKTSLSCLFTTMLSSSIDDLVWHTNWYENVTEIGLKFSPLHSQLHSTDTCIPHPNTHIYTFTHIHPNVHTVTQWAAADNACVIYGFTEREKRTPSEGEASDLCN